MPYHKQYPPYVLQEINHHCNQVCRVGEFNGKNCSTTSRSIILVDPNIEDVHTLKSWFKKEGSTTTSTSLTKRYSTPFSNQQKK